MKGVAQSGGEERNFSKNTPLSIIKHGRVHVKMPLFIGAIPFTRKSKKDTSTQVYTRLDKNQLICFAMISVLLRIDMTNKILKLELAIW